MFKMLDLSIASKLTEKTYTFPLKYTSSVSAGSNLLDMFPRQNLEGKLLFLLQYLIL